MPNTMGPSKKRKPRVDAREKVEPGTIKVEPGTVKIEPDIVNPEPTSPPPTKPWRAKYAVSPVYCSGPSPGFTKSGSLMGC
jgi:hypothetical protein